MSLQLFFHCEHVVSGSPRPPRPPSPPPDARGLDDRNLQEVGLTSYKVVISWEFKVPPPKLPPPRNKALLRDYLPLVSLKKALIGAYFLGG